MSNQTLDDTIHPIDPAETSKAGISLASRLPLNGQVNEMLYPPVMIRCTEHNTATKDHWKRCHDVQLSLYLNKQKVETLDPTEAFILPGRVLPDGGAETHYYYGFSTLMLPEAGLYDCIVKSFNANGDTLIVAQVGKFIVEPEDIESEDEMDSGKRTCLLQSDPLGKPLQLFGL